jgi:hypothetical protein
VGRVGGGESFQRVVGVRVEDDEEGAGGGEDGRREGPARETAEERGVEGVAITEEDIVVGTFGGKACELDGYIPE